MGLSLSPEGFAASSILAHVRTTVFFIGLSQVPDVRGNTLYSLWWKEGNSRPSELVRGVRDMQVLYGVKYGPRATDESSVPPLFVEGGVVGYYQWDQIPVDATVASIWISFVLQSVYGFVDEENYALARSFSLTYALQNMRPSVLEVSR